jgi:hypothetical protein
MLELPCFAVWFYVLIFFLPSFWGAAALAFVLMFATSHLLAGLFFLLGCRLIAYLDRRVGVAEETDSDKKGDYPNSGQLTGGN